VQKGERYLKTPEIAEEFQKRQKTIEKASRLIVYYPYLKKETERPRAVIGMFDPSPVPMFQKRPFRLQFL